MIPRVRQVVVAGRAVAAGRAAATGWSAGAWPPLLLLAVSVVVACSVAGCARPTAAIPSAPRGVDRAEAYRALDGLLATPALQALVELQIERDATALAAALRNPDARVRARAAFALASVQDTTAAPALISALNDADPLVRADVAHALGQTPTSAGAAALLERLRIEADTTVLLVLLDALGRAGGAEELRALATAELVRARGDAPELAAALALAYARFAMRGIHSEPATDWLFDALDADDRTLRLNAAYAFARGRDTTAWAHARDDLVDALDRLGRADRAAMHLLGALARLDARAGDVPLFADWLTASPDWAVRVNAARALAQRSDLAAARAALIGALNDSSHHVRATAATALAGSPLTLAEADASIARLGEFRDQPAVFGPLLVAVARAGRTEVVFDRWRVLTDTRLRRAGIGALAYVPGTAAFDALANVVTGADERVTAAAAIETLVERRALDLVDAIDNRYFDVYATALRTRDAALSYAAASALADSTLAMLGAGPLIQSVLLQMNTADDAEAMGEMVRALGILGDETAVPLLRGLRAGHTPALNAAAARALARITGEPVLLPPVELPPPRPMQWDWLAQWGTSPRIRFETERGPIVVVLSVEQAPMTAQALLTLASEGRFDDTPFHRVVPNFVVQGGDVGRGDGWGGPGFVIRSEFTRIPYLRGTAGMASSGKDTEGSQWFVTHSMQPHLDGRYSAFGTVLEGLDVVDAIRQGDRVIRAIPEPTPP